MIAIGRREIPASRYRERVKGQPEIQVSFWMPLSYYYGAMIESGADEGSTAVWETPTFVKLIGEALEKHRQVAREQLDAVREQLDKQLKQPPKGDGGTGV
ncbi:MAG: hypothetical protein HY548_00765 [Elusimicrobia bacterium]|nr:hypothetical protein [Elusimicrobiota bacterium]